MMNTQDMNLTAELLTKDDFKVEDDIKWCAGCGDYAILSAIQAGLPEVSDNKQNVVLFNNKIYGLTKGQYSPTTPKGSITKTSPDGTMEDPFKPGELVMGAMGTFFARIVDTEPKRMREGFTAA